MSQVALPSRDVIVISRKPNMSKHAIELQASLRKICANVGVTDRGMTMPDSISETQATEMSEFLFGVEETSRFIIGDFLNGLERIFRDSWTQFLSEKLNKRAGTIENWRYTCRNVPLEIRSSELSMSCHYSVAGLKSRGLQVQLLRIAEADDLSSDDLGKFSALFKPLPESAQDDWAVEIEADCMSANELLAAYNAVRDAQATTSTIEEDRQPDAFMPSTGAHVGNQTNPSSSEIEYSGEAGDYDWSGEKDEEPGGLTSLKVALTELYFSDSAEEYDKARNVLARLLQELDTEREEQFSSSIMELVS